MSENELEPVLGLPEPLPEGEEVLWQGAPRWGVLVRRAFFFWPVMIYFLLLVGWRFAHGVAQQESVTALIGAGLWLMALASLTVGLLALIGWLFAKSTVYTITSQRIVMRFGLAFPLTVNLPFSKVRSASLKTFRDGTGNISLLMAEGEKVSFYLLWPNIRPWTFSPAQPTLRAIADAEMVAALLSRTLAEAAEGREPNLQQSSSDESQARIGGAMESGNHGVSVNLSSSTVSGSSQPLEEG